MITAFTQTYYCLSDKLAILDDVFRFAFKFTHKMFVWFYDNYRYLKHKQPDLESNLNAFP